MKPKLILFSIVAISSIGASCGKQQEAKTSRPVDLIPNITIAKVSRSSVGDTYEATGTVTAKTTTQVSSNLIGRINSIAVSEGDTVRKGQTLVEIDDREAQAELEKALAVLKEAQSSLIELDNSTASAIAAAKTAEANKQLVDATFSRYNQLYQRRSVSGQEYDEALSRSIAAASELDRSRAIVATVVSKRGQISARIEQAKAEIANSKVHVSYSHIVSPVSGVIVKKFAEAGAMASPGVPLLSIEDNSQYRLETPVAESYSKMVHLGDRVSVRIEVLGTNDIPGIVTEILPTSDTASRSRTVKIDLPANRLLRTGLYGLAEFDLSQKEAVTIPQEAIVRRGQLTGIYVVGREGTVRFRFVTTGKTMQGRVEVLSGANEGDEVADSGLGSLFDGAKVR